ncbi:glycosyltransferase [Planctomycetota bacterium]
MGGAERVLVELINQWPTNCWKIYLATFSDQNKFSHILNNDKIVKHKILLPKSTRLKAIYNMYLFCKKENIDIALCHLERSNKWLATGARLAGCKVAITVHSINLYDNTFFCKKTAIRCLYNTVPDRIIAISDSVKKYLTSLGINHNKICIILNGVNSKQIQKIYHLSPLQKPLKLGVLGRLEPVKGLNILLESLSILESEGFQWSLEIIGEGSQRKLLENLAKKLGIESKINFHGYQKEPLKWLNRCSAICMPSYREGLPIALLESMSIGLPAVASDVGYLSHIIKNGVNGFKCQPGSPELLANSIRLLGKLAPYQWQYYSRNAQATAKNYDFKNTVKKYVEEMMNLLKH